MFLCHGFKKVWKELRVTLLYNLSMDISFKQIVLKASEVLSRCDYELFLIVAWYIWGERNQIVHCRKANPPDVVLPLGVYKLNVDASLDVNSNTKGIRAIVRDTTRNVLGYLCRSLFGMVYDRRVSNSVSFMVYVLSNLKKLILSSPFRYCDSCSLMEVFSGW
ncbi:hypothetical protein G4B88_027964 [Cannabis sativa]|uniref:Uncharacterized protein n=1 Tax=Cannabis sativa TaxID=3483 RepID=A0A7J6I6K8_CANSA|nr:hypothetical protein G4B88_027964 [Cannabis sativa]